MNHWGRIFFDYDADGKLRTVFGQPLENHSDNCKQLLQYFDPGLFHIETRERLFMAVELHDLGKKETFRITFDSDAKKFRYSFAGHRFQVPHDDPYVAGLIRAHHEFSVEQVNRERARLENNADKKRFADDLYLLCMVDQIEAELAVKAVEKKESVPRTFMEFTTKRLGESWETFSVVPWPFYSESFELRIELKEFRPDDVAEKKTQELERFLKSAKEMKDQAIHITLNAETRNGR